MILAFLLHHANREIKSEDKEVRDAFYAIKDHLLQRRGTTDGYDIQHIKGKRCNVCDGRGNYPKYGRNGKVHDYSDCYHCWGGWYIMPKWICLQRYKFGGYNFHKPLKRELHIGNPFTKENLGWDVTTNPVIEGYIDHESGWFGEYAMLILLLFYNRPVFNQVWPLKWHWKKVRMRNWFHNKFRLSGWILHKPRIFIREYWDEDFTQELPF